MDQFDGPQNAIEVFGLTKSFGRISALRNLEISVPWGTVLTILGMNGSGKSTLIKILATIAKPDHGTIQIAGLNPSESGKSIRRNIGFITHTPLLYPELTGRENLRLFTRLFGLTDYDDSINEISIKMGLALQLDKKVSSLSHGMRKRIDIARAMLHEPLILLMDEPESGLDQQALELLSYIVEDTVKKSCTVVMTTHNLGWASSLATQVAILSKGTIVHHSMDSPQENSGLDSVYKKYSGTNR